LKNVRPAASLAFVDADTKLTRLTFEAALARLESLVESMESGDVPLAGLLAKFEEGNRLLQVCEARLKDAEMKIEQLKKQRDSVTLTPLETGRES
jgi:exodeoxyribonuclease VII small subunit